MDYRCPACGVNLGKRRLTQAIVARMETDCSHCNGRLRLNIHRAEMAVVLSSIGSVIVLGGVTFWLKSEGWALATFAAAMLSSATLPLLELTYLRSWPRYLRATPRH